MTDDIDRSFDNAASVPSVRTLSEPELAALRAKVQSGSALANVEAQRLIATTRDAAEQFVRSIIDN